MPKGVLIVQTAVLAAAQKKPSRDRKAQNIILKTLSSVGGYAYASAWIDRTPCIPHAGLRSKASAPTVFGMVPLGTENIVSCNFPCVKHFYSRAFPCSAFLFVLRPSLSCAHSLSFLRSLSAPAIAARPAVSPGSTNRASSPV